MQKGRIQKDIELFKQHARELPSGKILDMATRYYQDAQYYLGAKDFFTAFGCINYAHGLLDALRMQQEDE